MLFHSGLILGGWAGVDVFFALSGFLITSLLLEEKQRTGHIELRHFYARRLLRLAPALLLCVVVVGTAWFLLEPKVRPDLVLILGSVMFYVANWAHIAGIQLGLFGHTWSLAIEEQFYLFWPPLFILLLRKVRCLTTIGILLVSAAGLSTAYRVGMAWTSPTDAFLLRWLFAGLEVRADSLLVGCALAAFAAAGVLDRLPRATSIVLGAAGAATLLTVFAAARFGISFYTYGVSTVAAVATTFVIADVLRPSSWLSRCLGTRPLVAVGKISYGLYVWHFSLFFVSGTLNPYANRLVVPPTTSLLLGWTATFAVAIASYWLIERRALALKARFQPGAAAPLAAPGRGAMAWPA